MWLIAYMSVPLSLHGVCGRSDICIYIVHRARGCCHEPEVLTQCEHNRPCRSSHAADAIIRNTSTAVVRLPEVLQRALQRDREIKTTSFLINMAMSYAWFEQFRRAAETHTAQR